MHRKLNCWEFKGCGKEAGGVNAERSGTCPVAAETSANGLNGGVNGGRICWVIAEACCDLNIRCSELHGKDACFSCGFRYRVMQEEGLLNICESTGSYLSSPDY